MLVVDNDTIQESHKLGGYWQSNRIVSLLDMIKRFDMDRLSKSIKSVSDLKTVVDGVKMATEQFGKVISIPDAQRKQIADIVADSLTLVKHGFDEIELSHFWAAYDSKIKEISRADSIDSMHEIMIGLNSIINYELESKQWFTLSRDNQQYLKDEAIHVTIRLHFPDCVFDLEEANKCIVFGRNTATVFHCMLALEIVFPRILDLLKASGSEFDPKDHLDENWNKLLNFIDKQIKELREKPQDEENKKRINTISEISHRMRWVKYAWRNPVMHARGQFSEEIVIDILYQTKSFLRYICSIMPTDNVTNA